MDFLASINMSPLLISLKTAIIATVIAFFGGIACARWAMKLKPLSKSILDGILNLPLVLPPTVAGFLLLLIFSLKRPLGIYLWEHYQLKVVLSWPGCVLAATVVAFPLMYRNARAAFEQVDVNYIYAGRTLGLSEWTIFRKVVIPVAGPGIASGNDFNICKSFGGIWCDIHVGRQYSWKDQNHGGGDRRRSQCTGTDDVAGFWGDCSGGHCLCLYFCNQHHNFAWHQQDSKAVKWHYQ